MATLVYSDADGIDRSFSLGTDPVLVGRGNECAIRSEDPRVSRMHARFFVEQGQLWVEDLGSSNGIYVGPHKIQRSPVPVGEIVLVGSLMIRLLPASGTLPPPIGLHGTLAQWLEMERKARAAVEEERNAFARRVGELHEKMRPLTDAQSAHEQDAVALRGELDTLRKQSAKDVEQLKVDLAKAREAKMIAETQAGMTVAEKLAEADMTISRLEHQLEQARAAQSAPADTTLADQVTTLTGRADKAERELAAAQIRAQGAERNLTAANMQATRAEAKAAEVEQKVAATEAARAELDKQLGQAREKLAALQTRLGAGDAPLQAVEARSAKLAAELVEMKQQLEASRAHAAELEAATAAAKQLADVAAAGGADTDKRFAQATARVAELEARLGQLSGAEERIELARKDRESARERAATADVRIQEAIVRADEAEKRASAADTMAKAMAKDVAEALRRAVDADSRARNVTRELDGAHRRAESAEKRDAERVAATREAEARTAEALAKLAEVEQQLTAKLERTQQELTAKADQLQTELGGKLEQAQRELAAERSTAMSLVDRKTQLERDLNEARTTVEGLQHRLELSESKASELEVSVEQLEERIQDLESGIAVEQTASQSSLDEARERMTKLDEQLVEAKAAAKTAVKTAAALERRISSLETELAQTQELRVAAEADLAQARAELSASVADTRSAADTAVSASRERIAALERAHADQIGVSTAEHARVEESQRRIHELEAIIDPLSAKAEAADLAIGRASALQRQLDEALQRLSWLERDGAKSGAEALATAEQLTAVQQRVRDAEGRARETQAQLEAQVAIANDADARVREANAIAQRHADHAREVEARSKDIEARAKDIEARAKDIEARAKDAAERIVDAERRARDSQGQMAELQRRNADLEAQIGRPNHDGGGGLERELAEAHDRIAALLREVDAADNVRQFAANTEREIAQLQRELRDTKAKLTQVTLEHDRLESQLRDVREDSETTSRRLPSPRGRGLVHDPEATAMADMTRYAALVARTTDLEQKLVEAEARLAAQHRAQEDEPTNTGNALPIEFAEYLSTIEEAIDSLRSNMRAASDETAMMDQTDSVIAVASAVSQAAEHVERARDAVRVLTAIVKA